MSNVEVPLFTASVPGSVIRASLQQEIDDIESDVRAMFERIEEAKKPQPLGDGEEEYSDLPRIGMAGGMFPAHGGPPLGFELGDYISPSPLLHSTPAAQAARIERDAKRQVRRIKVLMSLVEDERMYAMNTLDLMQWNLLPQLRGDRLHMI